MQVKRFYREVTVGQDDGGSTVLLDGRPVRTPARRPLVLPSPALAEAVAEEWQGQDETIAPETMPLTRLATTVVDLMPARRADAIEEVAGFAGTELLCYRAAAPASLVERQRRAWQPWLDWATREYDAPLMVADDVMPVEQPATSLNALHAAVAAHDDWRLVGLHAAATLLGSVVLALALERGVIDVDAAFRTALLDELFEIEQWGEEAAQQQRHRRLRAELAAAERFLSLLPGTVVSRPG